MSILYSENKFRICASDHRGLLPLSTLGPKALAYLTSLSVRLNACQCVPGHCCKASEYRCNICSSHWICDRGFDHPLGRISRHDRSLISEWNQVSSRIAAYIQPSRLRLFVGCDTIDHETAKEVVRPLLEMPLLKECSIRLGQKPSQVLRRLAEETICQITGRSTEHLEYTFRFTDLPEELRHQTLRCTDLVAPVSLGWNANTRPALKECCKHCTDALEACYCSFNHAAFAAGCTCWRMPTALFFVSHKMREDAIRVCFSENHFSMNFASPKFLSWIPQHATKFLRSVQLVLVVHDYNYGLPGATETTKWLKSIDFIAQNTNVPRLTLTIDMSSELDAYGDGYGYVLPRIDPDGAMWTVYQRIMEPMVRLKGLQNLFVHLSWPLSDLEEDLRHLHERILERRVMGDDYDSVSKGKVRRSLE